MSPRLSPVAALAMALILAACGSAPKKTTSIQPTPGKYYQDDGPPDAVPEGLDELADATPRKEPFHKYANRPYAVFGETYVPIVDNEPFKQRGLASWYGRKFQGQKTSSGETYDMFAMTAAHKTLPIPSYVKVTNIANGKSVVVRINDRGPFHKGRIIDLSYAAAKRIGIVGRGSAMVEVERVFEPEKDAAKASSAPEKPDTGMNNKTDAKPDTKPDANPGLGKSAFTAPVPPPAMIVTPVVAQESAGLWIQLGAFASAESAQSFRDRVTRELTWLHEPVQVTYRDGVHRVRLGPYRSSDEANAIAEKAERSLGITPAVSNNR